MILANTGCEITDHFHNVQWCVTATATAAHARDRHRIQHSACVASRVMSVCVDSVLPGKSWPPISRVTLLVVLLITTTDMSRCMLHSCWARRTDIYVRNACHTPICGQFICQAHPIASLELASMLERVAVSASACFALQLPVTCRSASSMSCEKCIACC